MAIMDPDDLGMGARIPIDIQNLIERFERDIVYDAHSLRTKYSRSRARMDIASRGTQVIEHIFVYLKTEKGLDHHDLPTAWARLVKELCALR